MDDIVKDENIVKNGISSVVSSSVDVVIHHDSSETSASDLPPSSPMKNSTTDSSVATTSAAATDVTFDISTPVNSSESPVSSDYSGTRFVVKRMASSDLQQFSSTSSSSSRAERTPSQSPKSVKFVVEKESPVKSPSRKSPTKKSPKKNLGLMKSVTTGTMSKLLNDPKELFSPISQDSFPSKEEIELPTISRGNVKPKRREETSDEDEIRVMEPDRSNEPLLAKKNVTRLSDSETDLLNRTQELTAMDVRRPGGLMGTVSVDEIPTTPLTTSHSGATTNSDAACENCILNSTFGYIGGIIGLIIGVIILLLVLYNIGYFDSNSKPVAEQLGNGTPYATGILKTATELFNASTTIDEPFTTQLPTTPNEPTFDTIQETDTVMTITNSPNIDDPINETTTNIPSIDLPTTATHN